VSFKERVKNFEDNFLPRFFIREFGDDVRKEEMTVVHSRWIPVVFGVEKA
jgi:hypothetical protein